jgi:hypothetical protein
METQMLSIEHATKLYKESGITKEVAELAKLSSMMPEEVSERFGHSAAAIRFPYPSLMFNDWKGDYRVRFDKPRIDVKTEKEQRYSQLRGSSTTLYYLPDDLPKIKNSNFPLIFTEGEKKHLSIRSCEFSKEYAVISTPGCFGYLSDGQVSQEYEHIPLCGRDVFFVGDSDFRTNRNVFSGYRRLIEYFISKGAIVHLIDLTIVESFKKYGADDFIVEFGAEELIKRLKNPIVKLESVERLLDQSISKDEFFYRGVCSSAKQFKNSGEKISNRFGVCQENKAIEFLKKAKIQFEMLCDADDEIIFNDSTESNNEFIVKICYKISKRYSLYIIRNTLVIVDYKKATYALLSNVFSMRGFLRGAISVKKLKASFDYKYFPLQEEFIEQIFYNPSKYFKGVKEIKSIVNLPYVFGQDGNFESGIHKDICHLSKSLPPIPHINRTESPLFKVLNYLPFKSREDRCDFLGCLVGLFFIPYHLGSHPMIILKGDGPGVNKSTIAEIIDVLVNAIPSGSIAFKANEEELEKQVATKILKSSIVIIDNMRSTQTISSPLLEKCATDTVLTFRQLGSQKALERPNDCLFILTLNGGTFSEDILDRSIVIELSHEAKKKEEFPYNGMISEYVREHKDEILQELGSMIRSASLHESFSKKTIGLHRFNDWASKVKNVMNFHGFSFLDTYKTKKMSSDPLLISLVRLVLEEKPHHPFYVPKVEEFGTKKFFFDEPKSAREILDEIKERKYELQNDLSVALLGKQLQRVAKNQNNVFEYEDERYSISVECLKSSKGGNNKTYSVKAVLILPSGK